MRQAAELDHIISDMPMDDRPVLQDPDYNPDEWQSPEDAQDALNATTTVESDPAPVNAAYNPEPQTEPISIVEGIPEIGQTGGCRPPCSRTATTR